MGKSNTFRDVGCSRTRAATQKELLETAPEASLLSATMNIPGEVKIRPP